MEERKLIFSIYFVICLVGGGRRPRTTEQNNNSILIGWVNERIYFRASFDCDVIYSAGSAFITEDYEDY